MAHNHSSYHLKIATQPILSVDVDITLITASDRWLGKEMTIFHFVAIVHIT